MQLIFWGSQVNLYDISLFFAVTLLFDMLPSWLPWILPIPMELIQVHTTIYNYYYYYVICHAVGWCLTHVASKFTITFASGRYVHVPVLKSSYKLHKLVSVVCLGLEGKLRSLWNFGGKTVYHKEWNDERISWTLFLQFINNSTQIQALTSA